MKASWIVGLVAAGLMAGCATPRVAVISPQGPWLDQAFQYSSNLVSVNEDELFALDPDLLIELRSVKMQRAPSEERINFIVKTLVDNKDTPFLYVAGKSTVAAQTWRNRKGDCLSLTVLAFAMAKELKLPVTMQEVDGTVMFDRRGAIDYRVGHVNVYVNRHVSDETTLATSLNRGVVIDFEPTFGASRPGYSLSRQAILARYYNNMGADYLSQGDSVRAYAYFKAAMQQDGEFSAAASNMAWLYWRNGYAQAAEDLLTRIAISASHPETAIRGLHRLLVVQGRQAEAVRYQALLEAKMQSEPYYWIDQGFDQLQAGNYRRAIESLEKAQTLTTGFSEVHRYLAVAYLRDGKTEKAQEQLETLAMIDAEDPALTIINRKILAARKAGSLVSSKASL
jgi:Flp pilus assembly protein TadD